MVLKEACIENTTNLEGAILAGANRIELCDNLAEGGTSVSYGVAKHVVKICHEQNVSVMAMVRPRKGNFVYTKEEISIMIDDILMYKKMSADGVVFGCITDAGLLDKPAINELLKAATGLEVTFHMAFDELVETEKLPAIDWLAEHGVTRILTHGGEGTKLPEETFVHWRKYIDYAAGRIIILPGGGIKSHNMEWITKEIGAAEIHGTDLFGER
ncbi:TPA: copper homeostasis protein CutC [Listeria innocua]|uniref:copper homeostasis protein CutC n=1 Tax=Listeria innocua TaxID=1642 RepID=UPI000F9BE3BC|nr:copper homeostasis protein CutC [Listeria innocua]QPQ97738.1 copper homeostasis protein CutC [Listeria welshimeri]EAD5841560.1 copper homeostasis protein CutC [Listeria innocua]EAG8542668.1 copper homeostasis protein CutC [Listeria innocua]ECL7895507.1 copper homeostasis protein CutC [Listeria innocua]ECX4530466.1 copper homeostasis protein CutC [Listeria innocua]